MKAYRPPRSSAHPRGEHDGAVSRGDTEMRVALQQPKAAFLLLRLVAASISSIHAGQRNDPLPTTPMALDCPLRRNMDKELEAAASLRLAAWYAVGLRVV